MSLTRTASTAVGRLVVFGVLALTLFACANKHRPPEPQMFRGPGWRGYMGLPSKGLEYRGKTERRGDAPDSVAVEVNVRNPSTDSVAVQISSMCNRRIEPSFTVRVYGPRHGVLRRRGQPVWTLDGWEQAKWRQAEAKRVRKPTINGLEEVVVPSCGTEIYTLRLGIGDTRSLGTRSIAMRDVLGDSLPPGRYLVSAQIRSNRFTYANEMRIGEIELRPTGR